MITHIAFATLYVSDQQRSLDFYVGKLGFAVHTDAEMAPGKRWIELELPGSRTRLVVSKADDFDAEVDADRGVDFALACDDVKKTYDDLVAKGLKPTEPVIEPWGSYTQVTDPDGYEIFISSTQEWLMDE